MSEKIIKFDNTYNDLLNIIKSSNDKPQIAKCCQLYSKLFSTEKKLRKNIIDIEKFIKKIEIDNSKEINPNHTETESDYCENIVKFI